MKLAIFWHDLLHYHAARIHALSKEVNKCGGQLQAYVLCSAQQNLPSFNYNRMGNNPIKILSDNSSKAGEFSSSSKNQLLKELDHFNPDAVAIIGYTGVVSRAALGWCRYHNRGAILMLSSHANDFRRVWWKELPKKMLVSLYDTAIVSGKPQIAYARQLGIHPKLIKPCYGVVDNDFWQRNATKGLMNANYWRKEKQLPKYFFLVACRFIEKKNLPTLINAYAQYVKEAGSNAWSLVLIGDGPLIVPLKQQVAKLKLKELVHFMGYLPANEMAIIYGLASTFILPSSHAEQWGLVINEAMATGLPVLVSNICGCVPDLVIEGKTGFSFDPVNESAMTALLIKISGGAIDLKEMGGNGQVKIQQFSPKIFAENLWQLAQLSIQVANKRRWRLWPAPTLWI